jgi:AP-4 complex subunit epsilon-1
MLLRQNAIEIYVQILQDTPAPSRLPRILVETMAWCLGEYGYLSAITSIDNLLHQLCDLADQSGLNVTTRKYVLQSILKLVAQMGTCPSQAATLIDRYTKSTDCDLQIRCLEFQNILTTCPQLLPEILPVDASAEDVDVDSSLSFLNGYVQQSLNNGARPYSKPDDDDDDDDMGGGLYANGTATGSFNLTPYEKPTKPSHMFGVSGMGSGAARTSNPTGVPLPPGAASTSPTAASTAAAPAANGGLMLNTRNVANVWGKGGLTTTPYPAAAPAAAALTPAQDNRWDAASAAANPAPASNMHGGYGSSYGQPPAPAPAAKTAAQLEKERQAAALFGGIIPGAPVPAPTPASAPAAPPPPPQPTAAAPPPPAPAPMVDLLDMSMWDAPAPAASAPAPDFDILSPTPTPAPAAPAVETVSDDEADVAPAPEAASAAAPPPAPFADPFAGAGLLDGLSDTPLASLNLNDKKFEFGGSALGPLQITTPQFGQKWGTCPATSPGSATSAKVLTLNQFMDVCKEAGAYPVEAIVASNEGICAAMMQGGSQICLIHGKVSPLGATTKIDFTVKSTDAAMGGSLALYLQTMLR